MGNVEAPRYWLPRPRRDLTLTAREPERPSDALFQCLSIAAPERERHADRGPKTVIERARGDFMRVSFATHHHPPRPTTPLFPHCSATTPQPPASRSKPTPIARGEEQSICVPQFSAQRNERTPNTEFRNYSFVCVSINSLLFVFRPTEHWQKNFRSRFPPTISMHSTRDAGTRRLTRHTARHSAVSSGYSLARGRVCVSLRNTLRINRIPGGERDITREKRENFPHSSHSKPSSRNADAGRDRRTARPVTSHLAHARALHHSRRLAVASQHIHQHTQLG